MIDFSNTTVRIMDSIINCYSKYSRETDQYHLNYDQIPESSLEELMGSLMADDGDFASEATGADNPRFESEMLPALITFMRNTGDKDELYEFANKWSAGIATYGVNTVTRLLEWRLRVHNFYMEDERGAA